MIGASQDFFEDTKRNYRSLSLLSLVYDLFCVIIIVFSLPILIAGSGLLFFGNSKEIQLAIAIMSWLGLAVSALIGSSILRNSLKKKVLHKNPDFKSAIDVAFGDTPAKSNAFWELYLNQISKTKAPKLSNLALWGRADGFLLILALCAIGLVSTMPISKTMIAPLSLANKFSVSNINILIRPPEYLKIDEFALDIANPVKIPSGSMIEVAIFGTQKKPKIVFSNEKLNVKISEEKSTSSFKINRNGKLEIITDKGRTKLNLKTLSDRAPKIKQFDGVIGYKSQNALIAINAYDDVEITHASIALSGKIAGSRIDEVINLPIEPNKTLNGAIELDLAKSALSGQRIQARIYLFDAAGNMAKSRTFSLNLYNSEFATPIARALNEIRLDILREHQPYHSFGPEKHKFYEQELGFESFIDTSSPIDLAPLKIKSAYEFLSQIANSSQDFGLDEISISGLKYANTVLESARTTEQAKSAAEILWEIIEKYKNPPPNTQSQIAKKIEELKSAISQGAIDEEIENLKQQLQSAINQHIEELSQNAQQSGDMEIEDTSNIDSQSISSALDNINSQTDPNDANAQLDALNQMLQNLKITENGEEASQSQDFLGAQKEILDETLQSQDLKNLGDKQEALARELMQSNQGKNQNRENAKDAMLEAAEALKNGDIDAAIDAQRKAIESLLQDNAPQNQNADPLGRPQSPENASQSKAKNQNEKIIEKSEESKSRSIIQKLRELLNKPDKSQKEQEYYEDLMRME